MYQIKPSEIYFNSVILLSVIYTYDLTKCLWFLLLGNTYWYIYIDSFAKIYLDFYTGTGTIVRLYTDNEGAPKDTDETNPTAAQTKPN